MRIQRQTSRALGCLISLMAGLGTIGSAKAADSEAIQKAVHDRVANHVALHPRLLLTQDAAAFHNQARSDARLKALWDRLIADADAVTKRPALEHKLEGMRMLAVSRDALHRIATLSLAYRVTGQSAYLEAARKNLATVARFDDFNPRHFLDVAEMTAALAIGYDWLYDSLPAEERDAVRRAIVEKGLRVSFATPPLWWVTSDNNWNQVCHGGLVLGALAVAESEPELAGRVIARAVESLPTAMRHYAPDGAYPEGASYWEYGTTYNLLALAAMETSLGTDFDLFKQPGFLATADYHLHLVGPTGLNFSYSDGNEKAGWYPAPAAFLLADRRKDSSTLFYEVQAMDRLIARRPTDGQGGADASLWLLMLWAQGSTNITPPAKTHFVAGGEMPVATHRSGWDAEATFVAIKGGSPSASHAHMDVGSFCLDANGVRWAGDLGLQEYGELEAKGLNLWNFKQDSTRWTVFRLGAMSHNVLTVNGRPQQVGGHAKILHSDEHKTVVDTAPVYAGDLSEATRSIELRPDTAVLLQDAVRAAPGQPAVIRWAMITHADATVHGQSATLTRDGKTLEVEVKSPSGITMNVSPAIGPQPFDAANPGAKLLTFEVTLAADQSGTIAVEFKPAAVRR